VFDFIHPNSCKTIISQYRMAKRKYKGGVDVEYLPNVFDVHRTVSNEQIYPAFEAITGGNTVSSIVIDGDIKRVTIAIKDADEFKEFLDNLEPRNDVFPLVKVDFSLGVLYKNGKIIPGSEHYSWAIDNPTPRDRTDLKPETTGTTAPFYVKLDPDVIYEQRYRMLADKVKNGPTPEDKILLHKLPPKYRKRFQTQATLNVLSNTKNPMNRLPDDVTEKIKTFGGTRKHVRKLRRLKSRKQ